MSDEVFEDVFDLMDEDGGGTVDKNEMIIFINKFAKK